MYLLYCCARRRGVGTITAAIAALWAGSQVRSRIPACDDCRVDPKSEMMMDADCFGFAMQFFIEGTQISKFRSGRPPSLLFPPRDHLAPSVPRNHDGLPTEPSAAAWLHSPTTRSNTCPCCVHVAAAATEHLSATVSQPIASSSCLRLPDEVKPTRTSCSCAITNKQRPE